MHRSTIAAALEVPYAFAALLPGAVVGTPVPVGVWVPEAEVLVARVADALNPDVADALLAVDSAVALLPLRTLDTDDAIDADEADDEDDATDEITDDTDATLDDEADTALDDEATNDDEDEAARVAEAEDGRAVIDLTVLPDSMTNCGLKLTWVGSVSETIWIV